MIHVGAVALLFSLTVTNSLLSAAYNKDNLNTLEMSKRQSYNEKPCWELRCTASMSITYIVRL